MSADVCLSGPPTACDAAGHSIFDSTLSNYADAAVPFARVTIFQLTCWLALVHFSPRQGRSTLKAVQLGRCIAPPNYVIDPADHERRPPMAVERIDPGEGFETGSVQGGGVSGND
jgi:hypothetical protein